MRPSSMAVQLSIQPEYITIPKSGINRVKQIGNKLMIGSLSVPQILRSV